MAAVRNSRKKAQAQAAAPDEPKVAPGTEAGTEPNTEPNTEPETDEAKKTAGETKPSRASRFADKGEGATQGVKPEKSYVARSLSVAGQTFIIKGRALRHPNGAYAGEEYRCDELGIVTSGLDDAVKAVTKAVS